MNKCEGCVHVGKWENEYEYGYPCPCYPCARRSPDNYCPEEGYDGRNRGLDLQEMLRRDLQEKLRRIELEEQLSLSLEDIRSMIEKEFKDNKC